MSNDTLLADAISDGTARDGDLKNGLRPFVRKVLFYELIHDTKNDDPSTDPLKNGRCETMFVNYGIDNWSTVVANHHLRRLEDEGEEETQKKYLAHLWRHALENNGSIVKIQKELSSEKSNVYDIVRNAFGGTCI